LSKTTHRLYFDDPYQTAFLARVVETDASASRVILDKTAFYPTSGGQPHDLGAIDGIPVIDVVDADDRIVHVLERPFHGGEAVGGSISWARRHDHMQQHTGQHLLSAVLADLYKMQTVSFHMGPVSSTIDLATPSLSQHQIETAELRANEIVQENRSVSTSFEDAAVVTGLRKPTDRTGIIRVVSIEALDRSACGGTHVRSTGEIGAILASLGGEDSRQPSPGVPLRPACHTGRANLVQRARSRRAVFFREARRGSGVWSPEHWSG
jgi:alanyl-tRNA synthetase